jgi:low affinity Fe/Cu permease
MRPTKSKTWFTRFAKHIAHLSGRPAAFLAAAIVIVVWLISGPLFGFSDTWQLVINTGTTIITFLMVFLIQATQNRDSEATQIKLDELIRAVGHAKNELLDLEELEEEELEALRITYLDMASKARESARKRSSSQAPADEADE